MNFSEFKVFLAAPTGHGPSRACAGQEYSRKCVHSAARVHRPPLLFTSGTHALSFLRYFLGIKTSSGDGLHRPYAIITAVTGYCCHLN